MRTTTSLHRLMPWRARTYTSTMLVALLSWGFGCVDEYASNPTRLVDTLGVEVDFRCDSEVCGTSVVTAPEVTTCEGVETIGYALVFSRFETLCLGVRVDGYTSYLNETCRPVICESDADCVRYQGYPYRCIDSVCEDTQQPLGYFDVSASCFAYTERFGLCEDARADPAVAEILTRIRSVCDPLTGSCSGVPEGCGVL